MNENIGMIGGTFNPIHNGHILLAKKTCEQFRLDEIWVMPSGDPPHKKEQQILSSVHRAEMVRLAIEQEPNLRFSDIEIKREGYSYTADTLTLLKKKYEKIYFILGADSLFQIEQWRYPEIIMKLSILVTANRDQHSFEEFMKQIHYLQNKYSAQIEVLQSPDIPISSSMIRKLIQEKKSISDYVPEAVESYILEHHLYS